MAGKRPAPLTKTEKQSVTAKARHIERLKEVQLLADANNKMRRNEQHKKLTEAMKEALLYRVNAGDTIRSVCREWDISVGVVNQAGYDDPEGFGKKLAIARENGTHSLVDWLLEIPFDESLTDARALLLSKNIQFVARTVGRKHYSETLNVNSNVQTTINVPDFMAGQLSRYATIEGQVIENLEAPSQTLADGSVMPVEGPHDAEAFPVQPNSDND